MVAWDIKQLEKIIILNASREVFGPSFYNVDNMVEKYAVIGA